MLQVKELTYRIAGRVIFDAATVHVPAGHKVGVVGPNGAGKSTLLRLIDGTLAADAGSIRVQRQARIAAVAQEAPGGDATPAAVVLAADTERAALLAELDRTPEAGREAEIHQRLSDIAAHAAPARAARILAGLGFDAEAQARPMSSFSGGWRMRVALAAVLFAEPDLLLLDEPTNYLDLEGVLWLEEHLRRYPRTVLLVSHDRTLLNRAVGAILHVDRGKLALYRGGYDEFERQRRERAEQQEKLRARQEAERAHMQAFVDRFRAKASKASQAQSRLKALARLEPLAELARDRSLSFRFPEPPELASPLLTLEGVTVGYTAGQPILKRLDLRLDADDRVALLGRNGNGKSTFQKLLAGRLAPQAGRLLASQRLKVGYFAQHQIEDLNPEATAFRHLAAALPDEQESRVRARLGAFGLDGPKADVAIAELSGGERARLVFATLSIEAPHLLLLDEPTNHLDIAAREALVDALNAFPGAVVLVSHDPHLLELVAERLWLVADGTVRPYDGDLDDYRRLLLATEAAEPARGEREAPRQSRRDDRRAGAEARQRLAPLRRALAAAETRLEKLAKERGEVERQLADPQVYAGDAQKLTALNRRHAELGREIEAGESRWLELGAELEAAEADGGGG